MKQRTCNLIYCCKGRGIGSDDTSRIISYLAMDSGCNPLDYDENDVFNELKIAIKDFVKTCDSPESIVYTLLDIAQIYYYRRKKNFSPTTVIESLFFGLTVTDNGKYVNGFTKELCDTATKLLPYDWQK